MKHLAATATRQVKASIEQAYALLSDVDGYPRWYPTGVPSAVTTKRDADGGPTEARATLAVATGPIKRDFDVNMSVKREPQRLVELRRLPKSAGDREQLLVRWRLAPSAGGTTLTVELDAELSVPAFLPVGSVGDGIAGGFADAAARALAS
jgi:ribosome-associated toxin RatA of RatAB toxin-antitoxin module